MGLWARLTLNHSTCYFCTPLGRSQNSAKAPKPAAALLRGRQAPGGPCMTLNIPLQVNFFSFISFHSYLLPPFISPRTLSKVFSSPRGTMAHCPVSRPPSCFLACVSKTTHLSTCPPLGTPAQPEHGSPPSPDPTALPSEPPPLPEGRRR